MGTPVHPPQPYCPIHERGFGPESTLKDRVQGLSYAINCAAGAVEVALERFYEEGDTGSLDVLAAHIQKTSRLLFILQASRNKKMSACQMFRRSRERREARS